MSGGNSSYIYRDEINEIYLLLDIFDINYVKLFFRTTFLFRYRNVGLLIFGLGLALQSLFSKLKMLFVLSLTWPYILFEYLQHEPVYIS